MLTGHGGQGALKMTRYYNKGIPIRAVHIYFLYWHKSVLTGSANKQLLLAINVFTCCHKLSRNRNVFLIGTRMSQWWNTLRWGHSKCLVGMASESFCSTKGITVSFCWNAWQFMTIAQYYLRSDYIAFALSDWYFAPVWSNMVIWKSSPTGN